MSLRTIHKMGYQINFSILLLCLFATHGFGQSDSLRYKLIGSLSKDIYKYYVSAGLARQMSDSIMCKYKTGGYDSSLNMDEFTFEITKDLRRISRDNHIMITPSHYDVTNDSISLAQKLDKLSEKQRKKYFTKNGGRVKRFDEEYQEQTKDDMFTYGDIKILPGNIGYVEIFDFKSASYVKEENKSRTTIASVFQYLSNTHSIIIDMRENQGGVTRLSAKFCSYFSKLPNSYFITTESFFRYDSSGTERELSYKKILYTDAKITNSQTRHKSIYILISRRTFSAAELAAYKIKQFAPQTTIIGEQTKGGGNGYFGGQTGKYYRSIIPSEKAFDESHDNYNIEGNGITPDISCLADSALNIAFRLASKGNLDTARQEVRYFKKTMPFETKPEFEKYYPGYIGDYRKISVYMSNGKLYMIYDAFRKYLLVPTTKDFFQTVDFEFVHFVRNSNNSIIEIQAKYKDGYLEKFRKL
jgi:hypothetical protein